MRRPSLRTTLTTAAIGVLLAVPAAIFFLPRLAYPPLSTVELAGVTSVDRRIELQHARSELQAEFRGQLLQGFGGLLVLGGVIGAWQQIGIARQGQITDRFTRAIDQLGNDAPQIRLGGIYALERIARDSAADRWTVTVVLAAYVRDRVPWPVGSPDGPEHPTPTLDPHPRWLQVRANDIQAAITVLGRRPRSPEPWNLYLSRTDLRSADLAHRRLPNTELRHANLARARMVDAHLEGANFTNTDLRQANLQQAHLAGAVLRRAHLQGANLCDANLRGADLRGADLTGARLDGADLTGVEADESTTWPDQQPPPAAGTTGPGRTDPAAEPAEPDAGSGTGAPE
ncbi:MAG TPA: pentapeptide repeat-containing protein [Mycobacteriales bacterium]|nr:pentapeptide repeat-containing protein [Mycobacteriales bacterium]